MGNLEKAGVGVVVALLLIIMVVAFTTDPQQTPEPEERASNESALRSEREVDSEDPDAIIDRGEVRPVGGGAEEDPAAGSGGIGEEIEQGGSTDPSSDPQTRPVNPNPVTTDPPVVEPKPQPKPEWPKEVLVKQNDSLWRISERVYGRNLADRMVPVVRKFNALKSDVLQLDQKLRLPAPPVSAQGSGERTVSTKGGGAERPAGAPPKKPAGTSLPWEPGPSVYGASSGTSAEGWYVVKRNESLSEIAQAQLGSVKYVRDIIKLNGITNPDRILAGTRLKMPARK